MNEQPVSVGYHRYGPWLRSRFGGERVHKVVIDAGFSCPNRDGSKGHGGCAYCNVDSFTPAAPRSINGIRFSYASTRSSGSRGKPAT